jgi:hypothetical protein
MALIHGANNVQLLDPMRRNQHCALALALILLHVCPHGKFHPRDHTTSLHANPTNIFANLVQITIMQASNPLPTYFVFVQNLMSLLFQPRSEHSPESFMSRLKATWNFVRPTTKVHNQATNHNAGLK